MSDSEHFDYEYADLSESVSDQSDTDSEESEVSDDYSDDDSDHMNTWEVITTEDPAPSRFQFLGVPGLSESNCYAEQHPGKSSDVLSPITLADFLVTKQTDLYGTLRSNRKDMPPEITKKKIKKGETIAYRRLKEMVMKWHDKKIIHLLSTVHNPEMAETNKKDKEGKFIKKPKLVVDYNNTMGGIDRLDQHLHDYAITRKRGKKFYKKIFMHLLDLTVFNSFILYKKNGGAIDNLQFRLQLVEQIIQKYHSSECTKKAGRPKKPGPLRLKERHFPDFSPPTKSYNIPYKRCVLCSTKKDKMGKKLRKETKYCCNECDVALCPAPCFKVYHTEKNY
nr:piggyBac transposable element-derived protein 4-like [Onthophagus taurus]